MFSTIKSFSVPVILQVPPRRNWILEAYIILYTWALLLCIINLFIIGWVAGLCWTKPPAFRSNPPVCSYPLQIPSEHRHPTVVETGGLVWLPNCEEWRSGQAWWQCLGLHGGKPWKSWPRWWIVDPCLSHDIPWSHHSLGFIRGAGFLPEQWKKNQRWVRWFSHEHLHFCRGTFNCHVIAMFDCPRVTNNKCRIFFHNKWIGSRSFSPSFHGYKSWYNPFSDIPKYHIVAYIFALYWYPHYI